MNRINFSEFIILYLGFIRKLSPTKIPMCLFDILGRNFDFFQYTLDHSLLNVF